MVGMVVTAVVVGGMRFLGMATMTIMIVRVGAMIVLELGATIVSVRLEAGATIVMRLEAGATIDMRLGATIVVRLEAGATIVVRLGATIGMRLEAGATIVVRLGATIGMTLGVTIVARLGATIVMMTTIVIRTTRTFITQMTRTLIIIQTTRTISAMIARLLIVAAVVARTSTVLRAVRRRSGLLIVVATGSRWSWRSAIGHCVFKIVRRIADSRRVDGSWLLFIAGGGICEFENN
jgi:hypothetical protein